MKSLADCNVTTRQIVSSLQCFAVDELAVRTRFVKRQPQKITPASFLTALLKNVVQDDKSLRNIAAEIGLLAHCTVSKQAVDKRFDHECVDFLQLVLLQALLQQSTRKPDWTNGSELFKHFKRVLVQDSLCIALPDELTEFFPGPANKYGQHATAKIQIILDLLQERFCYFALSPYTVNDQSASRDILAIARPGDLVIRDLGYFVLSVLYEMIIRNIYFLCRYRPGLAIFRADDGSRIDLLELLQREQTLDIFVYLGNEERVPVRLVAQPVPEDVAAKRRQRALSDRDRRSNHSEEYLALLGWNIFVTNVPRRFWTVSHTCQAYSFRWRIETIIKSWKSHFNLETVPEGGEVHVRAHILATLVFITLFHDSIFLELTEIAQQEFDTPISILKLSKFVKNHPWILFIPIEDHKLTALVIAQILYHCRYERRARKSYPQKFKEFG